MPAQKPNPPLKPRDPIRADLSKYVKTRTIADTLISLRPGDSLAFVVVSGPRQMGGDSSRWGKNKPPTVMAIETLPERRPALLILQVVLESKFELLGEDSIGKSYLVEAGDTLPGKDYRAFDVSEIEEV